MLACSSAVREWDANGTNFGYNPARHATAGEFGHNDFYPVAVAAAQIAGADGRQTVLAMTVLDEIRGRLAEVFDLQDQVATSVVGAITRRLEDAEIERAKRKPTEDLDAYDYYLRGLAAHDRAVMDRETMDEALQFFMKAIGRDGTFAAAYARAARCYAARKSNRWMVESMQETAEATRLAKRAVELGRDDAIALSYG